MSQDEKKVLKENLEGSINRLARRADELRRDLDIALGRLQTQQEMIEEVLASQASLKQFVVSSRQHADLKTEEVKDEIKETQAVIKNKVEDVSEIIKQKKIIKISDNGLLHKILRQINRKRR